MFNVVVSVLCVWCAGAGDDTQHSRGFQRAAQGERLDGHRDTQGRRRESTRGCLCAAAAHRDASSLPYPLTQSEHVSPHEKN